MEKIKYVIIGAGPTGLGAAYRFTELGEKSFLILEKSNRVGGLASSYRDPAGFTWDVGGHVHFSHYRYFDEALAKVLPEENWSTFQRQSWVWIKNRFVPYPFQYNIRHLPRSSQWRCLRGIWKTWWQQSSIPARNFEEWIFRSFGEGIAREFLLAYNFKVWGHPLSHMSYGWIGERVSVVSPWRVTRNVLCRLDDLSWGPNSTFRFPKKGGTGAVWKAFAGGIEGCNIRMEETVAAVHPREKSITLASGRGIEYDYLLSTIPMDLLTQMIVGLPDRILSAAKRLAHSTSHIVGVGLEGKLPEILQGKSWMYFPEDDCPFYRVTAFSNYSSHHTPDPARFWSLLTETSESPYKRIDRKTLVDETIKGLMNTRLITSEKEVVSTWSFTADYGYPIPTVDREDILETLFPALETFGIYSRGRFGAWRYEVSNQDHSFMQGVEWANKVVLGSPERVLAPLNP